MRKIKIKHLLRIHYQRKAWYEKTVKAFFEAGGHIEGIRMSIEMFKEALKHAENQEEAIHLKFWIDVYEERLQDAIREKQGRFN